MFGWTADEEQSFAVLDAYVEAGGNFIDTADSYSAFAPGNVGGESETIIGRWMQARGNRDRIVLATKVGRGPGLRDLAPATIRTAIDASLERLQTDYVDLYYAHFDDENVPIVETLEAFDGLVRSGRARAIGASNFSAERLEASLSCSERQGLARYVALQPHYSLLTRSEYEDGLAAVCVREGLACFPYQGLESGYLTGKYRSSGSRVSSERANVARSHDGDAGSAVLVVLDEVAGSHGTNVAAVALAWLAAQPGVVVPIASARTPAQLEELLQVARLELTDLEITRLADAGAAGAAP